MRASSIKEYTYSNLQHDSNVHSSYNEQQAVTVSYTSTESFEDHIFHSAISQPTIFEAIKLIREVEELNGGHGLSEWKMVEIKRHFKNNEIRKNEFLKSKNEKFKFENRQNQFSNNEILKTENEISQNEISKSKSLRFQMQKGYMSLLSAQM